VLNKANACTVKTATFYKSYKLQLKTSNSRCSPFDTIHLWRQSLCQQPRAQCRRSTYAVSKFRRNVVGVPCSSRPST